jgi:hypothetical protein
MPYIQIIGVADGILAVGIDQHINVRQDHRRTPSDQAERRGVVDSM